MNEAMSQKIRQVLAEHARLSADLDSLSDSDDLYQAGMTSHSSVNLMLALEDAFDVEFPDALLTRSSFESVDSIGAALTSLRPELAEAA
jgi:acyl carrier protein